MSLWPPWTFILSWKEFKILWPLSLEQRWQLSFWGSVWVPLGSFWAQMDSGFDLQENNATVLWHCQGRQLCVYTLWLSCSRSLPPGWWWHFYLILLPTTASFVAQQVKNLPAMWETWVWPLGWEDTLEKRKATHSSSLAWKIPWTVQSKGLQRVGHDWMTFTSHYLQLGASLQH